MKENTPVKSASLIFLEEFHRTRRIEGRGRRLKAKGRR